MPSTKRRSKPVQSRTGRLSGTILECITHVQKHFDPTHYPNHWYSWCEFHGRLPLLSEKTGRPLKTKVFSSSAKDALEACKYHKNLNLTTEVFNR